MLHTIASPSSRCKLVTFCQSMMWLRGVFTVFQQLFGIGRARAHTRLFGKNRKRYGVWLCCGNSSNERIEIIFWQFGTKDKINELKLTDTLRRFFISSASRHSKILRLEHQPTAFSKLAFCSRPWLSKTRKNRRELFWRLIKRKKRTLFLAEVLLLCCWSEFESSNRIICLTLTVWALLVAQRLAFSRTFYFWNKLSEATEKRIQLHTIAYRSSTWCFRVLPGNRSSLVENINVWFWIILSPIPCFSPLRPTRYSQQCTSPLFRKKWKLEKKTGGFWFENCSRGKVRSKSFCIKSRSRIKSFLVQPFYSTKIDNFSLVLFFSGFAGFSSFFGIKASTFS